MADELPISYDKRELRSIITAFKAMDDEAISQAKRESSALATYAANEIKAYGLTRTFGHSIKILKSGLISSDTLAWVSQPVFNMVAVG